MSKTKGPVEAAALPPPVVYPKYLLAVYCNHGTDYQWLATGENPAELSDDSPTVKVARYVLVGTGVIQHSAPQYVEHTAA